MDEGYVKFRCKWTKCEPLPYDTINDLNNWRQKLFNNGLIGSYQDGIGFGNVSARCREGFIISGTKTGNCQVLNGSHYTLVTDFNIEKNEVGCNGPIQASSETMTHAALYDCSPDVQAVFHVHHEGMWNQLLSKVPTSNQEVAYGTVAMAQEMKRLFDKSKNLMVMAGHHGGLVSFGTTLQEAGDAIFAHKSLFKQ